jgi:hypothetical protein
MEFQVYDVDPPAVDLTSPLEILILLGCAVGVVWILASVSRQHAGSTEWLIWRRSWLAGMVVGLVLFVPLARYAVPPYYPKLMVDWVWGSVSAAGLVMSISRNVERRRVARWLLQGMGAFGVGIVCPVAIGVVVALAVRAIGAG